MLSKIIARSLLIGIVGVSLGIILAVSGVSIRIVNSKSDWKTYNNRQLEFSFRYPPDWAFERDDEGVQTIIRVSGPGEEFSVTLRGPGVLSVQSFSRRAVVAGRAALIVDRSAGDTSQIYREAYFYDPDGLQITIKADTGITNPKTSEVLRTFRFTGD